MTQPIDREAIYRRRRFPREVIEGCVRWYLTYRLSYRDLLSLMAEWGVHLSHTTIMRWVFRYVPEYERRWNRRAKRWAHPGEWMRHTFGPGPGRATSTALSTSRERRLSRYFRPAAESRPPWPLSAKRWHLPRHDGRARSRWTGTSKVTGRCAGSVERIGVGYMSWCATAST